MMGHTAALMLLYRPGASGGSGGGGGSAGAVIDLVDAICFALQSDGTVAALTSTGDDGRPAVYSGQAPRAAQLPYVTVIEPTAFDATYEASPTAFPWTRDGQLQLSAFGTSRAQSRTLAVAATRALALAGDALTYLEGAALQILPRRPRTVLDDDKAPDGSDVWQSVVLLECIETGAL